MKITKTIALIGTLSLLGCCIFSCSESKKGGSGSEPSEVSDSTEEKSTVEATEATEKTTTEPVTAPTTEAPTEPETEPDEKISAEEQAKIDEACIACLTEFTQMEGYNPYDYPYKYTLCDINEDGIDELIVHYMSMVGEAEMLHYYEDGKYNAVASAPESGFDICIEEHFVQFTSWGGGEARTIVEIDGKDFKQDVLLKLPEGYQHNDVDILEDEFNKLTKQYDSYKWEKPEFEDFSNILPESVAFPEIDLSGLNGNDAGGNNGGGISIDPIVGTWKVSQCIVGDQIQYSGDDNIGYVFYADGTGYWYDYQSTINFTYVSSGINSYELYYENDTNPLSVYIEDEYLITWLFDYYKYYYERVS